MWGTAHPIADRGAFQIAVLWSPQGVPSWSRLWLRRWWIQSVGEGIKRGSWWRRARCWTGRRCGLCCPSSSGGASTSPSSSWISGSFRSRRFDSLPSPLLCFTFLAFPGCHEFYDLVWCLAGFPFIDLCWSSQKGEIFRPRLTRLMWVSLVNMLLDEPSSHIGKVCAFLWYFHIRKLVYQAFC